MFGLPLFAMRYASGLNQYLAEEKIVAAAW
jgi:hypothetical protein